MKRVFCLLSAIALGLMFAPHALADHTLVVDNDAADCPNADFPSIQAAVLAADPYTRIFICRGTYTEEVVIATPAKNGIELVGRGNRDEIVLDGLLGVAAPTGYNGIELSNVTDVLIRNFTVTRFHENIYLLPGANGNEVRHMVARGPSAHDGIRLDNAHGNVIQDNTVFANGVPPRGCGIDLLLGASNNVIIHNDVFGQDRAGIRLLGAGSTNVVAHNRSYLNGNGILNENTNRTLIEYNFLFENFPQGNQLGNGVRLLATGVLTASQNVVRQNQIDDNVLDGIWLENADGNAVERNDSDDNGRDGIRNDVLSTGNLYERNHMFGNGEHDAHDDNRPANTWLRNHCDTDFPPGTICGV
jgi:parallel beta-helix repeat protein